VVRPEVIRKRLNKLDEYLSILYNLRKYSFDDFVSDPEHYGSAERFLHLAIEAILDMGNHVIADMDLGIPRNKEVFERGDSGGFCGGCQVAERSKSI